MRQLAYIETIKDLKPIPGADKIECATILGWEVVCQRGLYNIGDKVIYSEIDSIFPELPPFEFLRSKKFRIRTIRLKQQISQGIAFPLSIINDVDPSFDISKLKVGDDVTEVLKITKHDPEAALDVETEVPEQLSWFDKKLRYYKWKLFGIKPIKRGSFPNDVPKTDEERVQKKGSALEKREGEAVYITEKLEGTSSTFIYRKTGNWLANLFNQGGMFQVCSRNTIVYNSQKGGKSNHHLITIADKYDLHNKLKKLNRNIAIQAETIGGKIQSNIYKLPELEMRVFLIFDIDKQQYLNFKDMYDVLKELDLPMVPLLYQEEIKNDIKYYVELSKGKSAINPMIDREGIVIRSVNDNFSFKSINPLYLLKQG